ncbi:MAG: hypothetical protein E6J91_38940 [Deltaproteobacteria bacterium]|nr:MAG: hypothetical protein E6J91_38940 [Deltaproteobacteria bacterium]
MVAGAERDPADDRADGRAAGDIDRPHPAECQRTRDGVIDAVQGQSLRDLKVEADLTHGFRLCGIARLGDTAAYPHAQKPTQQDGFEDLLHGNHPLLKAPLTVRCAAGRCSAGTVRAGVMRPGRASATIRRRIGDRGKTLAFERAQRPESRRAVGGERARSKQQMRTRRMKRSPGTHVAISALSGAAVAIALGSQVLFAGPQQTAAEKPAPTAQKVAPAAQKALTPFIDAHTHFEAKEAEASVRSALAALARENAAMILFQMPPDTFDHPGHYDAEVVLAEAKKHPEIGVLGGGGTLNAMIIQSAATGDAGPAVVKKFKDRADELLREGVIGFGEMTAEHYSGVTPYQYAPADHPLYLALADIAAEHGVPIDLHMEAVPEDMAVPPNVKVPPNPPKLHANIAAFERLLAHNPRAKIIWAHAGADGTGQRTPELCRRLLRAHANLVMEIKTDPRTQGMNYPLADGKIKPDWLALFKEFPDRFIIGSDQHYPEPDGAEQRWQEAVRLFNQLPADVRRKIGTENVFRIYPKIASRANAKK